MALALALLFKFFGLFSNFILAAILFSTVALGVVIAVLKENELLNKRKTLILKRCKTIGVIKAANVTISTETDMKFPP